MDWSTNDPDYGAAMVAEGYGHFAKCGNIGVFRRYADEASSFDFFH